MQTVRRLLVYLMRMDERELSVHVGATLRKLGAREWNRNLAAGQEQLG